MEVMDRPDRQGVRRDYAGETDIGSEVLVRPLREEVEAALAASTLAAKGLMTESLYWSDAASAMGSSVSSQSSRPDSSISSVR